MARIFVGGVPFDATAQNLKDYFQGATGYIPREVMLPLDEMGQQRGFCFVEFASFVDVDRICRRLWGAELGGRTLRLSIARPAWITNRHKRLAR